MRRWLAIVVTSWRLSRRLGRAGAVEVMHLCGEEAVKRLLDKDGLALLVHRAARSVWHGASVAYLRRAVPAWADELHEQRYASADWAMRMAMDEHKRSTEARDATYHGGT